MILSSIFQLPNLKDIVRVCCRRGWSRTLHKRGGRQEGVQTYDLTNFANRNNTKFRPSRSVGTVPRSVCIRRTSPSSWNLRYLCMLKDVQMSRWPFGVLTSDGTAIICRFCRSLWHISRVKDQWWIQDFQMGAPTIEFGPKNLKISQDFAKNCMKMKAIGRGRVPGAPYASANVPASPEQVKR